MKEAVILPDAYNPPHVTWLRYTFQNLFLFILPASLSVEFELVGRLFLPEILLLFLLPVLIWKNKDASLPFEYRAVLVAGILWIFSQLATDLVRQTDFQDWVRGISKITFLLTNYFALYYLVSSNKRRFLIVCLGLGVGLLVLNFRQGYDLFGEAGWKFGNGLGFILLVLCITRIWPFSRLQWLPVVALVALSLLSLSIGARSIAAMCLGTAFIVSYGAMSSILGDSFLSKPWVVAIVMVLGALGILWAYNAAAAAGVLGEGQRLKFEKQVRRGEGSVLEGGRLETKVALTAIADSPILGHGSWAHNPKYANIIRQRTIDAGQIYQGRVQSDSLIPSHSHILGAWVQAGILGALFWGIVGGMLLVSIIKLLQADDTLKPIYAFLAVGAFWDIAFSPFGSYERISAAVVLLILSRSRFN